MLDRRLAITWTNDDTILWHNIVSLCLSDVPPTPTHIAMQVKKNSFVPYIAMNSDTAEVLFMILCPIVLQRNQWWSHLEVLSAKSKRYIWNKHQWWLHSVYPTYRQQATIWSVYCFYVEWHVHSTLNMGGWGWGRWGVGGLNYSWSYVTLSCMEIDDSPLRKLHQQKWKDTLETWHQWLFISVHLICCQRTTF